MSGWQRRKLKSRNMREPQVEEKEVGRGFMVLLMGFNGLFSAIYITDKYMSNRKNPGNTKYVLDGHWLMEIDGNC